MKQSIEDMTRNQLIGNLRSYKGNCKQQSTEIKKLREALKPFADLAGTIAAVNDDDSEFVFARTGDLRDALAVLKGE